MDYQRKLSTRFPSDLSKIKKLINNTESIFRYFRTCSVY